MIKFLDLEAVNRSYEPEITDAISRVCNSGWYINGAECSSFEREYAGYIGTRHCIGVGNGLDSLNLILKAYLEMGVLKEGDEVIVPANTFIATILAITHNRLKPVLTEPELKTFNLDISAVEKHLSSRTRAIMVVHLYGRACWENELIELAEKHDLIIIEDNAQAAGARITVNGTKSKRTGSLGDAAGHSFYPGKNLGAMGDGGAVTTDDDDLAKVVRSLSNYGSLKKYEHDRQGVNSRLDEIQAGILRVKLKRLDSDNQIRRVVADLYCKELNNQKIILPATHISDVLHSEDHVWHLFVIRTENRDLLKKRLAQKGIETAIHYPVPPHKQKAYKELYHSSLPVTEKIHQEVLSLPISHVQDSDTTRKIIETVNSY